MPDQANQSSSEGRYVVVARRYRPRTFTELVGQKHIAQALANAIETGRVGHAYLFTGARGVGKTSTARIFAKCLNAPGGPSVKLDNEADVSQAIDSGEDVDVLEIDGASNRGIDEIRQLRAGVGMRPSRSRYKIYIIDEVHMLTQAAFNALLKTLEEPPEHVKFIFCTTDPEKIPITVLSRCQRFDFAPIDADEILNRLREIAAAEGAEAEEEALRLLARRAAGSMRDSQSLLEQVLSFAGNSVTVEHINQMLGTADDRLLLELADHLAQRRSADALQAIDRAVESGVDCGQLAEQLLGYFRDMLAAAVGCGPETLRHARANAEVAQEFAERGQKIGVPTLLSMVQLIDQAIVRMRQSVHGRVLLEVAAVQICHLPDLQALSNVLAGLDGSGGRSLGAEKKKGQPEINAARETQVDEGKVDVPKGAATAESPSPTAAMPPSPAPQTNGQSASTPAAPAPSPAAPPPRSAAANPPQVDLDAKSAPRVWSVALNSLEDFVAEFAKKASGVELEDEQTLRVRFPGEYEIALNQCQQPERKTSLEQMVSAVAGKPIRIQFDLLPRSAPATQPSKKQPSAAGRVQRMREAERDPFVQQVIDLFEGEIVKVDQPR